MSDDLIKALEDFQQENNYASELIKSGTLDKTKLVKVRKTDKTGRVQTKWVAASVLSGAAKRVKNENAAERDARNIEAMKQRAGNENIDNEPQNQKKSEVPKVEKKVTTPNGKLGRHEELHGHAVGDTVTVKHKGSEVKGEILYWNANKTSPEGYAVVQLEDGTRVEKTKNTIIDNHGNSGPSNVDEKRQSVMKKVGEKLQSEAGADDATESLYSIPVNERYATMEKMIRAVAAGLQKSLIIYGTGGTGKTYSVDQQLKGKGLREYDEDINSIGADSYDYVKITGKVSPSAVYRLMYEHNGKTVVFDDCDGFLSDDNAVNMLKGALDTSGDGTVSNETQAKIKDSNGEEIPKRFKFQGRCIFISNLPPNKVPQPLKSRSLKIDMTLSKEQTIERIGDILGKIDFSIPGVTDQDKRDVLNYLKENMHVTDDINVRTMKSLLILKEGDQTDKWKKDAKVYMLSKAQQNQDIEGILIPLDQYFDLVKSGDHKEDFKIFTFNMPGESNEKLIFKI